jgi:L-rhamnose mutarotase
MSERPVQRFGMVIGLRPDCQARYRELHAGPGVRHILRAANIQNFSIYLQVMPDGKLYEFGYYEYVGAAYATDMANLAANPTYREWLAQCDPMQIPLPGHTSWAMMESVYFQE